MKKVIDNENWTHLKFDDDNEYDKWYESLNKFPDETRVYIGNREVIYLMDDDYIEEKCYG
jgi:hypothetical protein|tara:strand:- start:49 stop:228 length:180 start_codon:yes stop_codon:yes gene_type:complete